MKGKFFEHTSRGLGNYFALMFLFFFFFWEGVCACVLVAWCFCHWLCFSWHKFILFLPSFFLYILHTHFFGLMWAVSTFTAPFSFMYRIPVLLSLMVLPRETPDKLVQGLCCDQQTGAWYFHLNWQCYMQ